MFRYGNAYDRQIEVIREKLSPYDVEEQEGKIYVNIQSLPHASTENWGSLGPTSDEMWDAQEDLWLLTSLVEAVATVNGEATSVITAPIKTLQELQFFGGSKKKARANSPRF